MRVVTKFRICGITCNPKGEHCNNYCNYNHDIPMPDNPATYEELIMEDSDMWKDVLEMIVEYVPGEKSLFQLLEEKYLITKK